MIWIHTRSLLVFPQLFASKDYKCGEEILTIAAMTAVQDVFVIPDGGAGALAELERRKFTAEEGVSIYLWMPEYSFDELFWRII